MISFDHLKTACGVSDADIETFKKIMNEIIRIEKEHITVVDYNNGKTFFPAVIRKVNDEGVVVYRKDATIVDNTAW
jgi:hypothetical protein